MVSSAAEVHLLKPVKEGQETPAPSQPQPPSTPEKPKVEQTGDGTVELADQFLQVNQLAKTALQLPARAQTISRKYKVFPTPQK